MAVEKERSPRQPLNIYKPGRGTKGFWRSQHVDLKDCGVMKAKREGVFEKEEVINCGFRSNDEEPICEEDSFC